MKFTGGAPPTVLVVDDDADSRECVRDLLEGKGIAVAEATNGQVALERMESIPDVAVVVLDLEMPVMSGHELVRIMKENPRLSRLQVLILSGSISVSVSPRGPPISGLFNKPCDPKNLVAAVEACILREEVRSDGRE